MQWSSPAGLVIGATWPGSGSPAVADPRIGRSYDHGWGVIKWTGPTHTVAGSTSPGSGAYQVADPRVEVQDAEVYSAEDEGSPPLLSTDSLVEVQDAEVYSAEGLMGAWDGDQKKPPPFIPVILSPDGCWHRPLTTLELALLQGLPAELDGRPLELTGSAVSRWRQRIGNAVPVGAAEAISRQMLIALTEAALGEWSMQSGPVWVSPTHHDQA